MTTTTYEQVLSLVRGLDRQARARLVADVVQELALEPVAEAARGQDAWARWAALRDDIGRNFPDAHLSERLDADRRERDEALRGTQEADDVHA